MITVNLIRDMTIDELRIYLIEANISTIWKLTKEDKTCQTTLESLRRYRDTFLIEPNEVKILDFCIELAFYRCQLTQITEGQESFVGEL